MLYYGARYYDPQLGQFISPDSLVPDATNLFDYNRYMYARGNPMRYNDPTGHCATSNSGTPDANDSECWRYANTILAQWDNNPDYWNDRFYSKDAFQYVAANPENHADGFHDAFMQYLQSDAYKTWAAQQPSNPSSKAELADPVCAGQGACQAAVRASDQVAQKCREIDCAAVALDAVSTGAMVVAAGCTIITAGVCAIVAGPATAISTVASGVGTAWTASQVLHGIGTEKDLWVSASTLTIGSARDLGSDLVKKVNPWIGLAASGYQLYYDTHPSTENRPTDQQ